MDTDSADQQTETSTPVPLSEPEFYKVPHRFDLATIFVVTFAYAAFLGVMNSAGAPLGLTGSILGMLTLVGIVQMFVSKRRARLASVACGWAALGLPYAVALVNDPPPAIGVFVWRWIFVIGALGALFGYIAGTVVAGIFLVSDYVRRAVKAAQSKSK